VTGLVVGRICTKYVPVVGQATPLLFDIVNRIAKGAASAAAAMGAQAKSMYYGHISTL
jgi:hypothetical protein